MSPAASRGGVEMKVGLVSFAPVYLNGLLALFCVFVLPGLIFVRAFSLPNFPQRMLVIFLASIGANYFTVVLIATLHIDPLATYRLVVLALMTTLMGLMIADASGRRMPFGMQHSGAIIEKSDLVWLALSLAIVCLAYFNIWKRGVPNIFGEGDVSISWNTWARVWSHGLFPAKSGGYPQFIPALWAVTYIFTGSDEHYFAYYIYLVLIIAPPVLVSTYLGRAGRLWALLPVLTFVWFVAEIQDHWLRATLEAGFPDWTAAVAGYCGVVLFMTNDPGTSFDRQKIVTALASECLILTAAATKPIYGLMAIAVLICISIEGATLLREKQRTRFLTATIGLFAAFAIAYLATFLHLAARFMPNYPVSELAERLSRGAGLFKSSFSLPFRIIVCAGIAFSALIPRVRWLTLPLLLGTWLWMNNAGYDLRNLFGVLLVGAFITLFAAARTLGTAQPAVGPRWRISDGVVAAVLAVVAVVSTHTLALDDAHLNQRFRSEQLDIGAGTDLNQKLLGLLQRGCFVLTAADYPFTMTVFENYLPQLQTFHWDWAVLPETSEAIAERTGCTGILYPPPLSGRPVLAFVKTASGQHHYVSLAQANGWELLATAP
jgi:hypothetical protein